MDPAVALARRIAELERQLSSLSRASQISRSTVNIGGTDLPVPDAIGQGVQAGIDVEQVQQELDQARADLEAAQDALKENLEDAEDLIAGATTRLDEAESQITDAFGRIDTAEAAAQAATDAVGAAIAQSIDEYVVTDSSTTPPPANADWSSDTPDWGPGDFVWRRSKNIHIDETITYSAPAVMTGADGTPGEDAVLLRVSSSRGTSFKNNAIATVLTVTVFKGSVQITNITDLHATLGSGAFIEWWWRRMDDSDFGVISSADPRLSQAGFALTVSPADVDEQTVFQAVLNT